METKLLDRNEIKPEKSELLESPIHIQFYDHIEKSWNEAMDFHVKKMDISFDRLIRK
ncbi:MAG TPA: hypothetical protein VFF28_01205 [Candidatus Nanoarchaeia archaeon]|nr:hypothetical protein [Candidatus Nanoarchaeia archaeon]